MNRRFQFSIRLMLVATAVVACALGAIRTQPSRESAWLLGALAVSFASLAVMFAAVTRGRLRAFWVGASVAALAAFCLISESFTLIYVNSMTTKTAQAAVVMVVTHWRDNLPIIWAFVPVNRIKL